MKWITDRRPVKSGGFHVKGKNFALTSMFRSTDKTFVCEHHGKIVEAWLDETERRSTGYELNILIGTSGKYHGEIWKFKGSAEGWELINRVSAYNTRDEVENEADIWLLEYKTTL